RAQAVRRTGQDLRRLPAVLDLRRADAVLLDGAGGLLLLRDGELPGAGRRGQLGHEDAAGPEDPLGAGLGGPRGGLRRRDGGGGLPEHLLRGISPFELPALAPYNPGFLSGFLAEQYQVDLAEGWEKAKASIESQLYSHCASEVPGDAHSNLHVDTAFSAQTFK